MSYRRNTIYENPVLSVHHNKNKIKIKRTKADTMAALEMHRSLPDINSRRLRPIKHKTTA
jgi:hypothetical protein